MDVAVAAVVGAGEDVAARDAGVGEDVSPHATIINEAPATVSPNMKPRNLINRC